MAALAFLLSVSTDAPLGAVGGAVLLQILSSILDQITALGTIRNFLPTHYGDAWLGLLSTPVQTDDIVKGCDRRPRLRDALLLPGVVALPAKRRGELNLIRVLAGRVPSMRTSALRGAWLLVLGLAALSGTLYYDRPTSRPGPTTGPRPTR